MSYAFEGAPPPRAGAAHASIYPYGPFAAGDGGTVMLGLQNEREWKLFCELVLEEGALATDARFDSNSRRSMHREELDAIVARTCAPLTRAEVLARLDRVGIANASVNDVAGLWAHPQLQARQRWRIVGSPAGDIPALLPPGRSDRWEAEWRPFPPWVSTPRRCCARRDCTMRPSPRW